MEKRKPLKQVTVNLGLTETLYEFVSAEQRRTGLSRSSLLRLWVCERHEAEKAKAAR